MIIQLNADLLYLNLKINPIFKLIKFKYPLSKLVALEFKVKGLFRNKDRFLKIRIATTKMKNSRATNLISYRNTKSKIIYLTINLISKTLIQT